MKELLLLVLTVVTVMAIPKPIREELQPAIKGSSDQPDSRQLQNQLLNILEARVLEKKKNDPLELDERWMEGCGSYYEYDAPTFTEPTGVITSPGWRRGSYPKNLRCMWVIEAPVGQSVEVTFDKFQLLDCAYESDDVELFNGAVYSMYSATTAETIDGYCGTYADNSLVVTSTGNVMSVGFGAGPGASETGRGFKLRWKFVQQSTRGLLGQMVDLLEHGPGLENQEN